MLRPEAEIISKHLRVLVGERNPYTSLNRLQATGRYLSEQFHKLQLGVLKQEAPFNGIKTHNILGHKTGTEKTGGTFVLGAHYDTVEGTPGADDNASAVAALLEIARCLQPVPLKNSLIFACFTLEEYGFAGSRHFVQQARRSNLSIRGMISMEMIGFRTRQPGSQSYPDYVDPARYPETGDFIALV
ncbi:MAG: M28 family peptidase, partial [Nitrospinales bacterium]